MKLLLLAVFLGFAILGADGQAAGTACTNGVGGTCDNPAICDSDGICKHAIDADCTTGNDANCPVNAVCGDSGSSGTNTCECSSPFSAVGVFCQKHIGVNCTGTTECVANTKECTGSVTTCTCNDDYTAEADNTECRKAVGGTCSADTDCVTGSFCDGTTCKSRPDQACSSITDCGSNSTCISNKCVCDSGYSSQDGECKSSASGLVISALLVMLSVVTSRLL